MPGRDQTGPMGEGPMTGRRMGICNNNYSGRQIRNFGGRGFGFGAGLGYGCRRGLGLGRNINYNNYYNNAPVNDEEYLKNEKSFLENQLSKINETLEGFKKEE